MLRYKDGDLVKIVRTHGNLDNLYGTIIGVTSEHGTMAYYTVLLANGKLENGYRAIQITEHCLKRVDSFPTKKVLLSTLGYGFRITKECVQLWKEKGGDHTLPNTSFMDICKDSLREDKHLIAAIEELGDKATEIDYGYGVRIVEIPYDLDYTIVKRHYALGETIVEKHRTWEIS